MRILKKILRKILWKVLVAIVGLAILAVAVLNVAKFAIYREGYKHKCDSTISAAIVCYALFRNTLFNRHMTKRV